MCKTFTEQYKILRKFLRKTKHIKEGIYHIHKLKDNVGKMSVSHKLIYKITTVPKKFMHTFY